MPDSTTDNEELEKGVINVGGRIIGSYVDLKDPRVTTEYDYILIIRVNADGTKRYGKYTVDELIAALGAEVTQAAQEASDSAQSAAQSSQIADEAKDTVLEKVDGFDETVETAKEEVVEYLEQYKSTGYRATIGDGVSNEYLIRHNLHTTDIMTDVVYLRNDVLIPFIRIFTVDADTVKVKARDVLPENSVRIMVWTVGEVKIATLDAVVEPEDLSEACTIPVSDIQALFNKGE